MTQTIDVQGQQLAYQYFPRDLTRPGVTFLSGFRSSMHASKSLFLKQFCADHNLSYLCFDYQGHGQSSGRFEDGSIGLWKKNAQTIIQNVTGDQPQLLIGSSMGGWIMLLLALEKPHRIHSLIGIATAPDFPQKLILTRLNPQQRQDLASKNHCEIPVPERKDAYKITQAFLTESVDHHVLDQPALNINCPVVLLQGMEDPEVPWHCAIELTERITSKDVTTILIKNGNHSLSTPAELQLLGNQILKLIPLP